MKTKQAKTYTLRLRVDGEELLRVKTLMENNGYPTVSSFLRDVIFKKKIVSRKEVVNLTDKVMRDKMNQLIYQVNRIGVNYNQVVAIYQKQSQQTRRDGTPYMSERSVEEKLTTLMRMTEEFRDEFAVLLDVVKRYTGDNS